MIRTMTVEEVPATSFLFLSPSAHLDLLLLSGSPPLGHDAIVIELFEA